LFATEITTLFIESGILLQKTPSACSVSKLPCLEEMRDPSKHIVSVDAVKRFGSAAGSSAVTAAPVNTGPSVQARALSFLETIDRVARWLPAHEPKRPGLLQKIEHIRQRIEASQPASLAILLLRTEARSLTNGPLRTALTRQIEKVCRLYNLTGR
jgi:hypothetical protein